MATSITQYSITVHFSADHVIGTYTNGDYYVVGAASITSITVDNGSRIAGSTVGRDGAVINPPINTQGFDSRDTATYSAALNKTTSYPFDLATGDRLVCAESFLGVFNPVAGKTLYLNTAIVLTCVAVAPAAGTFRPAYSGPNDKVYNWSSINKATQLPSLTPTASVPSLATVEGYVARAYLNTINDWAGYFTIPYLNSQYYGREVATYYGDALLMAICNEGSIGNRDNLIKGIIQVGIDIYGMMRVGRDFLPNGGWLQGRAGIFLMAAYLLQDADMLALGGSTLFQENSQTFYITQADVSRTNYVELTGTAQSGTLNTLVLATSVPLTNFYALTGNTCDIVGGTNSGLSAIVLSYSPTTSRTVTFTTSFPQPCDNTTIYSFRGYESSMIGNAEWGIRHGTIPANDNPSAVATYRSVNSPYWFGQALALAACGQVSTWNHQAFWEYLDDETPSSAVPAFHKSMAEAYWSTYYSAPIPTPSLRVRAIPMELQ